jgi:hypothetical protein
VCFFSADLLITLMSSQLFVGTPSVVSNIASELSLPNPEIFTGAFYTNQPFLNYIYQLLAEPQGKNATHPLNRKKLLTSLLTQTASGATPAGDSIVSAMAAGLGAQADKVDSAAGRLQAAVRALESKPGVDAAGDEPAWALNGVIYTLGSLLSLPIKALHALLLKVQDGPRDAAAPPSGKESGPSYDHILGASGSTSGLVAVPIYYTPAPAEGSAATATAAADGDGAVETRPLVYVLPAARTLCRRPFAERCGQLLLLLLFNKRSSGVETGAYDYEAGAGARGAGSTSAVSLASGDQNGVRDLFCCMCDEEDEDVAVLDAHKPYEEQAVCNFKSLSLHLARELVVSETASLLVYCLLQYNSTFLHSLMSSKGTIVLPCIPSIFCLSVS